MQLDPKTTIEQGKAILGIELGSTRIKAVLIDGENKPIAQGCHEWENQLADGLWTYSTEAIWYGLQDAWKISAHGLLHAPVRQKASSSQNSRLF